MKTHMSLILLLGLSLSCGRSNDTSTSKGKPERQQNPQQTERTEYTASVVSKISVSLKEITFLESLKDEDKDRQGHCFVETRKDTSYPFRLFENELVLNENGREVEFTRTEGRPFSLNGTWSRVDESDDMNITTTLQISNSNELKIQSVCRKK